MRTQEKMSGIEKASVLLMSLGHDALQQVMSRLSPEERDILDAQMVRMRSVGKLSSLDSAVRERVFEEVCEIIRSGSALHASLPGGSARRTAESPFAWLDRREPDEVMRLLADERPRTIAIVLSHLSPGLVADVMGRLDEKTRDRVARSLVEASRASDDIVQTIAETLHKRAAHTRRPPRPGDTLSILSALGEATSKARESVLAALKTHSGSRSSKPAPLRSLEELSRLPDWRTRAVLGGVDLDDLCLALKVASDDLKAVILRNVSPTTAALLRERLENTAQVKVREIEIAQQRVLSAVMRAFIDTEATGPTVRRDSGAEEEASVE